VKKIIIDTNAYTRFLTGDEDVLDVIAAAETTYLSIFVLGELYAGFAGGTKESKNKEALRQFLLKPTVKILNATSETAEVFGFVKSNLRMDGTPVPINDVWIAAHGIETGSTIITYDTHFKKIAGVRLWDII
jgi:tRNA(fMet)-specific endonuclease VapC